MTGPEKIARRVFDLQTQIDKLGRASQLGNTTIAGGAAVPITEVVAESAVTNDALPDVQEDIADNDEGVSDLTAIFDSFDADMDARFEEARAELDDARSQIEDSMSEIDDTFSTQYEGLSEDVDTAIRAAGDAKTEAEAASDAALAAAGLAASKGETIVQVSAPSGSRANTANLWIDISANADGVPKNQPNRYNPDTAKWEPITDAQAVAAAQTAANAITAAQAAKDVADQANAAAGVAKQTAVDANTAALQAAGIANSKGKVIPQASKPTGANAAAGNLWIRTSDNTPWVYDPSIPDWVQVTDKNATDAAAAAVQAQQAATAAANAAQAAQATADSKPLILFSSTSGPSGTAPTGSTWFLWDSAKNIAGQWLQSGTLAAPVWTPQQITSQVIANLDLGKLTAGSAAIADLVAQKIAASTANFQTVNVSNLFVTSGATMSQATIDYLFANVVMARKITAGMIDVATLNGIFLTGITVTGGTFKTAASGRRAELDSGAIRFYDASGTQQGTIQADVGGTGSSSGLAFLYNGESPVLFIGPKSVPSGVATTITMAGNVGIAELLVGRLRDNTIGSTDGYVYDSSTGTLQSKIVRALNKVMVGGVDVQLGDTDWIQPALAGGTNDSDSPFRYRRLNGVVYFDGLVAPTATNQRMFVLPAGFRPARIRRAWIDRNGTATPTQWIVRVHSGGAIDLIGPSGGSGALDFGGYPPFPAS